MMEVRGNQVPYHEPQNQAIIHMKSQNLLVDQYKIPKVWLEYTFDNQHHMNPNQTP